MPYGIEINENGYITHNFKGDNFYSTDLDDKTSFYSFEEKSWTRNGNTKNNILYYGENDNSSPNGKGLLLRKDGSIFIGNWEYGNANGIGYHYLADDNIYYGQIEDNMRTGYGIIFYNNSKLFGEFQNDILNGYYSFTSKSSRNLGEQKDGEYINFRFLEDFSEKK